MKRIFFLLLISATIVLLHACKKNKNETPPPEPVAAYDFTNSPKNFASPKLHGLAVGIMAVTTDSFNTPKSAYKFGGQGYIKVDDSDILDFPGNEFTFSAWIYPSKTDVAYVIHKGEKMGSDIAYSLDIFPGYAHAGLYTSTDEHFSVQGQSKIIKDVWQHIAVTLGNEQLTIYYNGKSEGSTVVDRPLKITNGDLIIGAYQWAFPAATFEGKIDQVRLYDKALTAAQVMNLYKNYK